MPKLQKVTTKTPTPLPASVDIGSKSVAITDHSKSANSQLTGTSRLLEC